MSISFEILINILSRYSNIVRQILTPRGQYIDRDFRNMDQYRGNRGKLLDKRNRGIRDIPDWQYL